MLAIVSAGMIGLLSALVALPFLYVSSKNREIDLANPENAKMIRRWVAEDLKSKADQYHLTEVVQSACNDLYRSNQFNVGDYSKTDPIFPQEIIDWLRANGPGGNVDKVEEVFNGLKAIFGIVRVIPHSVPPLDKRLSVLIAGFEPEYYVPILCPIESSVMGHSWTLAVSNPRSPKVPSLKLDPADTYSNLRTVGLRYASELLFLPLSTMMESGPDELWRQATYKESSEFWELRKPDWVPTVTTRRPNQRLCYMPVDDLIFGNQLAGILAINYDPETAGMVTAMDAITSSPGFIPVVLIVGIALILFSLFCAYLITRPVQMLAADTHAVMDGDLDQGVRVAKGADVGAIAEDFNELKGRLRTALKQLEKQAEIIEQKNVEIASLRGIDPGKSLEEPGFVTEQGEFD